MTRLKSIGRALLVLGVLVLSGPAFGKDHDNRGHGRGHSRGVPEIDPVTAGAAVTLLVGGVALIGARRARRRKNAGE